MRKLYFFFLLINFKFKDFNHQLSLASHFINFIQYRLASFLWFPFLTYWILTRLLQFRESTSPFLNHSQYGKISKSLSKCILRFPTLLDWLTSLIHNFIDSFRWNVTSSNKCNHCFCTFILCFEGFVDASNHDSDQWIHLNSIVIKLSSLLQSNAFFNVFIF